MTKGNISIDNLPVTGFLRQSQLIPSFLPFSSATLWRKVAAGSFPRPFRLSERITAWRAEDIRAWVASREMAGSSQ